MASGAENDPIVIDVSVLGAIKRHFFNMAAHGSIPTSLFPDYSTFWEEMAPKIINEVDPDQCFTFSADPNGTTLLLTFDAQTESYYVKRVVPRLPESASIRLPGNDTAASWLQSTKKNLSKKIDDNNPFKLWKDFDSGNN